VSVEVVGSNGLGSKSLAVSRVARAQSFLSGAMLTPDGLTRNFLASTHRGPHELLIGAAPLCFQKYPAE
jgi:hypothetical protein